ncbi:REP-associated tyrosine transposase [Catenovulum adriaticum]|uniref:Transposase n=1 Tax=Catenovulum adriaticum TaxID=2984846 RepID=A0ABY7AIU8_9ALTE|nr:transposase [Catenovulum sp. TS8]WAJ69158.1 transposase [Catenovulum sp. TS8]
MRYRRVYVAGGSYFFTVNLQDKKSQLLVEQVDLLRESVRWVKQRKPFRIDAWVVLPNHLHAVWTLPKNDTDYSGRWREIKKRFRHNLAKAQVLPGANAQLINRPIWQKRFWEHTIRNQADFNHHIDYVHINPLKHGLVKQVKDWPYSSFHRAVLLGDYLVNWCG